MRFGVILAINTSSLRFSLALLKQDGGLIGEYSLAGGPKGSRPLFPALQDLLVHTGSEIHEVEALAVAAGPGSFTGLRVGVSMAKGLCQALDVPLVSVPTLEALASQLAYTACEVCPVIGSRKGEIFAALFRSGENGEMIRMTEDICLRISALANFIQGKTIFVGDDFDAQAEAIREASGENALLAPPPFWSLKAAPVGLIGLKRLQGGISEDLDGYVPAYHRPPDLGRAGG